MGLFGAISWKVISQAVPLLAGAVLKGSAMSGDIEKEQKEINALKAEVMKLHNDIDSVYKNLRVLLIGVVITFLIAISALVVAIIATAN